MTTPITIPTTARRLCAWDLLQYDDPIPSYCLLPGPKPFIVKGGMTGLPHTLLWTTGGPQANLDYYWNLLLITPILLMKVIIGLTVPAGSGPYYWKYEPPACYCYLLTDYYLFNSQDVPSPLNCCCSQGHYNSLIPQTCCGLIVPILIIATVIANSYSPPLLLPHLSQLYCYCMVCVVTVWPHCWFIDRL